MGPAIHVSLVQASNSGVRCLHFFGTLGTLHHAMMLIWTKISENVLLNVCNKELRQFKGKIGSQTRNKAHFKLCSFSPAFTRPTLLIMTSLMNLIFFNNKNYSVFSGHLCNISKTTASCKISLPVISCLPAEFKNKGKNSTCLL